MKPNIAKKYFNKNIREDQFEIRTAHGKSLEKHSVVIPSFKIFNNSEKLKFHLFDFHGHFDCLIGVDILNKLEFCVDFKSKTLRNENVSIKLHLQETSMNMNKIEIFPECEQVIQLDVKNLKNGKALIRKRTFGPCFINEGIVNVQDGKTVCTVINPTEQQLTLTTTPIVVEEISQYEISPSPNLNNINTEQKFSSKFDFSMIRTEHMNEEEKEKLKDLLEEFNEIFHVDGNPLTSSTEVKHKIHTFDEVPIYTKPYRYPEILRDEIRKQIASMLDQNIIQKSHSPWSSPLWIVPKKKDASGRKKWRIVIDYSKLNDKTISDKYPIPNITDLLDKLGRAQYFTTLDLASGYLQIKMDEDSIAKTAFTVDSGHYEYLRMPMGLKNSPSTFQRVMDDILRGLVNECCLVYLDDIIIFGPSLQQHLINLKKVFTRIRDCNFKIQLDKSEFLRKEVEYLGHVVTRDGVKPNPNKIEAIRVYPIPKTVKQIKGFLGLLGYYRRFIRDFAKITKPMTKCLKKNAKIDINNVEYKECFERCKKILLEEPILQFPDFSKTFNLTTDASNVALGAVLSQGTIGQDKPIAYASRTLNDHERNYSTIEKELLAIVWATKYFRPYLYGRKFKIITDHRPLQWIFSIKEPSSKLVRWRLQLEEYNYEIVYKKGSLNTNADALSRVELYANELSEIQKFIKKTKEQMERERRDDLENASMVGQPDQDQSPEDISDLDAFINEKYEELISDPNVGPFVCAEENQDLASYYHNFAQEIFEEEDQVPEIEESTHDTHATEQPPEDETEINTVHSSSENPIIGIPISDTPLNVAKNQIIFKLVEIPPKAVKTIILHKNKHRLIIEVPKIKTEEYLTDIVKKYIAPAVKYNVLFETPELYEILSRTLQRNFRGSTLNIVKSNKILEDITNERKKTELIREQHEGLTNHRGIKETYNQMKEKFYWPDMAGSIQMYINECEVCQTTKYDRKPLKPFLNKTPTAVKPFEIVHLDTITLENTKFLTVVDSFSKFAQAYALPSAQAIDIADKLLDAFSHHGLPTLIITDNGREFKNVVVQELLSFHKIDIHFNSSQHPESNGIIERFHSTLVEHIRVFNNRDEFKSEPISTKVKYAILAYNHSIHSVTKLRPIQVITGHFDSKEPIIAEIEQKLASNYINSHKDKMKMLYKQIREDIESQKEKVITERNKSREPLPQIPEKVYVVNRQKQSKTKNKYKQEKIVELNKDLKTAKIEKSHPNTSEVIHLSNVKRPKCVAGPSKEPPSA